MAVAPQSDRPSVVCCPQCQARIMLSAGRIAATSCPFCHEPLESAGDLGRMHAAAQRDSMLAREEEARGREAYRQQLRLELIASGQMPAQADLVVLPAIEREVVPLGDDRKQKFLAYIAQVAEQALRELEESDTEIAAPPSQIAQPPEVDIRRSACSLCRGACCVNGGEHGYLLSASLVRWLREAEPQTVASIVALYESFLPAAAYAGSCVFHTERGCMIPPAYRSNTCNAFICQGLAEFETHADAPAGTIMLTANRDGQVVRRELVQLQTDQVGAFRSPRGAPGKQT